MSFLWERYIKDGTVSDEFAQDAGVLPALRRGDGAEPGSEPAMWRYYSRLNESGSATVSLWAEHLCLTLFGIHQQGERKRSMHQDGIGFGTALRALRSSGKFSEDAVDARVERLATATQPAELGEHLSSLIRLMRAAGKPIAFDYTKLYWDLINLQDENKAGAVRRRWGGQYFASDKSTTTDITKER